MQKARIPASANAAIVPFENEGSVDDNVTRGKLVEEESGKELK